MGAVFCGVRSSPLFGKLRGEAPDDSVIETDVDLAAIRRAVACALPPAKHASKEG